jgi:type IX secretion system PorP/SprF family membrane protein
MKQRLSSIGVFIFMMASLFAQDKLMLYSHYSFSGLAINPAYAGSHQALSASVSHRNQWIGFEGAPAYNIVSIHTPFKDKPMGLGLLIMNESMGLRKFTGIYANYAHKIRFRSGILSMGIKAGIGAGKFEGIDLGDDQVFNEKSKSYLLPNFGLGFYFTAKKYNLGFSIPLLLGYKANESGDVISYHDFSRYAYYLTGETKIRLDNNWQIKPSALLAYERASGIILDGGASVIYKEHIRCGLNYRLKQAVIMLLEYQINYQLRVGLAYDYGIGSFSEYSRSSAEITLEYNLGYKVRASNPTIF